MQDLEFDEWWVVVDAWQRRETALRPKTTQYCWPSRPTTYVVGPRNLRRWELKLLPGETPADFDVPEVLRAAMRPYVDVDAMELWRHAAYRFSARIGAQWSKGRVFLAGDAVHTTPPFLGQGLCAGIRDAYNLAWKLHRVIACAADPALLDSYEQERRPHVSTIISHAKDFGLIIGEMNVERARLRDAELGALLASGKMETSRQGFIPGLTGGILARNDRTGQAGRQMVQPRIVGDSGGGRLLDDVLGQSSACITIGAEAAAWAAPLADRMAGLGVRHIALDAPDATADPEYGLSRWLARTNVRAVLVRPDRYIYSGIMGPGDLEEKFEEFADALMGVVARASV